MTVLGIDIAKLTFDATLCFNTTRSHQSFPNTPAGFAALDDWLSQHGVTQVHACMEATNVYWEALAIWLHARDHIVSVVNPARIKGFAQASMQRNKTDKLDSAMIAAFCATHHPSAWEPLTEAQQHLRALVRHRDDLLQTRLQLHNRLRDTTNTFVRASLQALLDTLKAQMKEVEHQIAEHQAAHATLQAQVTLLSSVIGIGVLTATKVLAECGDLRSYASAKAVVANVGVNASHYESGTSVRRKPRMSKIGNARVRAALYLPALTAMRCCAACKSFVERLRKRGKPIKVIIGAVMRKLLHAMYGVLKHQTPYDPAKAFGAVSPTT